MVDSKRLLAALLWVGAAIIAVPGFFLSIGVVLTLWGWLRCGPAGSAACSRAMDVAAAYLQLWLPAVIFCLWAFLVARRLSSEDEEARGAAADAAALAEAERRSREMLDRLLERRAPKGPATSQEPSGGASSAAGGEGAPKSA